MIYITKLYRVAWALDSSQSILFLMIFCLLTQYRELEDALDKKMHMAPQDACVFEGSLLLINLFSYELSWF